MRIRPTLAGVAAIAAGVTLSATSPAGTPSAGKEAPVYGVTLPDGFRRWELIAPARETEPLDELRAVVGNDIAVSAFASGALPFPNGTILVKLAWKHVPSRDFEPAFVPGAATTIQVMVKDSRRYASSGGWGFGRFRNGEPADEAEHQTCFACHEASVKDRDYVFTRWAP